jgi:hypothetical protein
VSAQVGKGFFEIGPVWCDEDDVGFGGGIGGPAAVGLAGSGREGESAREEGPKEVGCVQEVRWWWGEDYGFTGLVEGEAARVGNALSSGF